MNFLAKRSLPSLPSMSEANDSIFLTKTIYTPNKISHSVLGVCSAVIAFPLVTLAIFFSVFLPQETWEEFWDKFLES